ncbi:hypothetical protein [Mycolicibacterium grossiae]|uniref:Uncharacterized protein n=1 Tax=Mycolicibacterium grossiae TaxID=1552759 RepID=A0A1E8Q2U1_9MYCO|nr:hypothetical protein [Mycolicibacterium grossiae]OFJ52571.1 hypothetical protein BEL07_17150 [Mycolicibacterium grossiae]QEM47166.1 hypothetical protein FZ046_22460 [Mycolicibacterium grossiae]
MPAGADDATNWWDSDDEYRIVYTPELATGNATIYGSAVQRPDGTLMGAEDPPRVYPQNACPEEGLTLDEARQLACQILTTVELLEGWQR